ncbi:MAG: site-specific DNA-methyltransferase [Flagellimonas sp.]
MSENDKLDLSSPDLVNENFEKLAELFPNCVTESSEGKAIDFDLLKQELSHAVVEGNKERYRLEWPGKKEAIVTANLPTTKTLRPIREDSVDFDNTENLYIEGDNLEVLKLLQESYLNKIKLIYIDPPYNTGNDFVYKDNFSKDSQEELLESGQKDEYNQRLISNPETSGRYHSDWLSMMYPRLKLARNLLNDKGFIFISIDDNELDNLLKIGKELFGQENCIGVISWQKVYSSRMDAKSFSKDIDYVVVFRKSSDVQIGQETFVQNEKQFSGYDEKKGLHYRPRGLRKDGSNSRREDRPNLYYSIEAPDGTELFPIKPDGTEGTWRWSKEKFSEALNNDEIEFRQNDGSWQVIVKQYKEANPTKPPSTFWPYSYGHNHGAVEELKKLFNQNLFSSPKPTTLLQKIIEISTSNDDIVLDFFSGSSSLADAVLQYNSENSTRIKHIQVQLPEETDEKTEAYKAGYRNICEIGKERIRRAAKKIKEETGADIDYGFRVYRLDESNMEDVYYKPQEYSQDKLDLFADNVKADRTPDDLLAQVMLDWGLPLSLKIEQANINGKKLFKVAENSLYACFDDDIDEAFAKAIAEEQPLRIVFKDSGFKDDTAKTNVKQLLKQLSPETEMKVI